jgi:hypothetical protein
MNPQTQQTVRAAEEAVSDLIQACRKGGPLYQERPKAVAQVSRNAKWLLNALAALRRELKATGDGRQES